jgi:hypothetical protein
MTESNKLHRRNNGGSKHFWSIGKPLADYKALQTRRQVSLDSDYFSKQHY